MDIKVALINWKNFFRSAIGLEKQYPIKVVRIGGAKEFEMIKASKKGDVGYNLTSVENMIIPAMTDHSRFKYEQYMNKYYETNEAEYLQMAEELAPRAVIPTGVKIQMPSNLWCSIEARSSSSKKMLITPDAIIDSGYTGEMFVVIFNFGYKPHHVEKGDQLAQLIFHERISVQFTETNTLGETERGETGFGSSGQKAQKVGG